MPAAPDGEAQLSFFQNAVRAYGRFLEPSMITCFENAERPWGIVIGESTTEFLRADAEHQWRSLPRRCGHHRVLDHTAEQAGLALRRRC